MKLSLQISKVSLVLAIATSCAQGQDFYWNTASARSMALGGVYVPTSDNALDALSANPAGLTALSNRTVDVSVTSIFARGSFTNSVNTNAPYTGSPGVMPYGAFGTPLGHSRWSIGMGVVPELTSVSEWRYVDAPGVAGATYGLQTQKSAIVAARSVAGVGFALSKKISLGVSMGAVYNSNTLTAPYIFQSHPALAGLKTLLDLHTTGVGWNTSVGVLARPSSKVQISAAWKSRTTIDSTGDASGNIGVQLAAIGLGAARPDFHYSALVHNVLPQSFLWGVNWKVDSKWTLAAQSNWVNWHSAFSSLPVSLTNGNNADINGLLGTNTIFDQVPVAWKDQFSIRGGVERQVKESFSIRAGYAHSNSPVPASTLSPLTAAIMTHQISTGVGYRYAKWVFDLGYAFDPTAQQSVQQSGLLSGEYSNSTVRLGLQALTLNASLKF